MSAKSNLAQKTPADIALVVFGTDKSKKLHASRFGAEAAETAQEAARTMGMQSFRVISNEQREVARRLPKGRFSPKGLAVVPLIRPPLYKRLLEVAGTEAAPPTPLSPPPADPGKKPAPSADAKPDPFGGWTGLVRGAVVLATDDPAVGWFEAGVQHVDGETLTLLWKDWPDLPKFNRKLTQVALLHPKMTKPC